MKKIILPAGPEPKRLTARALPQTLFEHRLAFLATNNKDGFGEEHPEEQSVFGINTPNQYLLESRSVATSLLFQKTPLKDAEYFSLRVQKFS